MTNPVCVRVKDARLEDLVQDMTGHDEPVRLYGEDDEPVAVLMGVDAYEVLVLMRTALGRVVDRDDVSIPWEEARRELGWG